MRNDKRKEGLGVPNRNHVSGDPANRETIVNQVADRPNSQQHTAGETLESDADVMLDVKAACMPPGAGNENYMFSRRFTRSSNIG